jgi:hypothetical protein
MLQRLFASLPLTADEDEFDPFAPFPNDPDPGDDPDPGEVEGDDRVHAPGATPPGAAEPGETAPEERP